VARSNQQPQIDKGGALIYWRCVFPDGRDHLLQGQRHLQRHLLWVPSHCWDHCVRSFVVLDRTQVSEEQV
jgi:hypothetical protein